MRFAQMKPFANETKGRCIYYKGISRLSYLMCESHTKKIREGNSHIYRNSANYGTWKAVRNSLLIAFIALIAVIEKICNSLSIKSLTAI